MLLVQTNQLLKSYGSMVAVDHLTFSIDEGQIYGIVGPDGAGKTTFLRMLCGILLPTSGSLHVLDIDLQRNPERVKPMIGYMAQKFSLYGNLSVMENLRFFSDLFGADPRSFNASAERLLGFAGMWKFRSRLAKNLSGGMKQKLALCCTMIHTPKLLILDEPTTGVDPVSRHEFWEMLRPLPSQGTSVIVSTGYMDEAEHCHRIALLHEGRLLAEESRENILRSFVSKLVEVHCQRLRDARTILLKIEGVHDCQVFGDRLHLFYRGQKLDTLKETILEKLASAGINVEHLQEIAPRLEDVFMEKVGKKEALAR